LRIYISLALAAIFINALFSISFGSLQTERDGVMNRNEKGDYKAAAESCAHYRRTRKFGVFRNGHARIKDTISQAFDKANDLLIKIWTAIAISRS